MMFNAYRRAALYLHSLSDVDRNWVLARLPNKQGQRLMGLIDELHVMGVPADQSWLIETTSDVGDSHLHEKHSSPVQQAELEIESANFTLLQFVLDAEPDTLVALILDYRAWSWSDSYLQACEPQRSQRIVARKSQGSTQVSTRVIDALILGLAEKLCDPDTQEWTRTRSLRSSGTVTTSGHRFWRFVWQR